MIKSIVLVTLVGTVVAGCSVRTERVVEAPAATTTQRTTTVSVRSVHPGRNDHDHDLRRPRTVKPRAAPLSRAAVTHAASRAFTLAFQIGFA